MDSIRNFFSNIYNLIMPPPLEPVPITVPTHIPNHFRYNFERDRREYERRYNIQEQAPEIVLIDMVIQNLRERNRNLRKISNKKNYIINNLPILSLTQEIIDEVKPVCSICLEDFIVDNTVVKLPCGHFFCFGKSEESCQGIIPWLKNSMTCPVCRDVITIDDF
tara:strand:- start:1480 stop:1971 length:492 start_codon:yes stop_codon:yes gene_type:complete